MVKQTVVLTAPIASKESLKDIKALYLRTESISLARSSTESSLANACRTRQLLRIRQAIAEPRYRSDETERAPEAET
jgi:hypothetical protein